MDKVKVIWRSYHEDVLAHGYWDNGLLDDVFDKGSFEHLYVTHDKDFEVKENEGAVFVINGRTHDKEDDIEKINADIAKLRWVLFMVTGDEEAVFPWRQIKHPIMRVWVMLPRMNEHNDTSAFIPNGYRAGTTKILADLNQQERYNDFIFIGQVNHARREQCIEAAEALHDNFNGLVIGTDSFGKEVYSQHDYLVQMTKSKIALCPSGIESPDNFRLYEALEAGCLPVVDAFATNNQSTGFWFYLFKENPPFPILDYWDKLPLLMPSLLKSYPENANKCFAWWQQFKRKMYFKLIDDIKELSK